MQRLKWWWDKDDMSNTKRSRTWRSVAAYWTSGKKTQANWKRVWNSLWHGQCGKSPESGHSLLKRFVYVQCVPRSNIYSFWRWQESLQGRSFDSWCRFDIQVQFGERLILATYFNWKIISSISLPKLIVSVKIFPPGWKSKLGCNHGRIHSQNRKWILCCWIA